MVGGHLQRTGYRHGVLAIAASSALVAAMYTQSSFYDSLAENTYGSVPILSDAYTKLHRLAAANIALNAITCALTALMSLVIDWHLAIRTPAYIEFSWIGLVWCIELVSAILIGTSAPHQDVCSIDKTPLGSYEGLVMLGKGMCSNWKAVLVTSVISLIFFTFHFTWHLVFRLWHRAALAKRPTSPTDLWNTPLPKYYPINPHEVRKKEDPVFLAFDESEGCVKPENSIAMDPYSRIFRPVAARVTGRAPREDVKKHEVPVVNVTAPLEDQPEGAIHTRFNASETSFHAPPGLETRTKDQPAHSSSN